MWDLKSVIQDLSDCLFFKFINTFWWLLRCLIGHQMWIDPYFTCQFSVNGMFLKASYMETFGDISWDTMLAIWLFIRYQMQINGNCAVSRIGRIPHSLWLSIVYKGSAVGSQHCHPWLSSFLTVSASECWSQMHQHCIGCVRYPFRKNVLMMFGRNVLSIMQQLNSA